MGVIRRAVNRVRGFFGRRTASRNVQTASRARSSST